MKSRGFTLIELIVVVSVIAVLAGIVVPTLGSLVEDAKDSKMVAEVKHLCTAILQYDKNVGYLPYAGLGGGAIGNSYASTVAQMTTLNNLIVAYVGRRIINDPWNRSYRYRQNSTYTNMRAVAMGLGRNNYTTLWSDTTIWSNRTEVALANGYYLVFK
jgi:type II secretion system protein G